MKKKECAKVKSSLKNYLRGHVFKLEAIKIERHLKSCPVCSSEYQALKRVAETRQILRDVTPPEGMLRDMKDRLTGVSRLKKLVYRPLWVVLIAGTITLIYFSVFDERRRDMEIENLEKALPPASSVASAPTVSPDAVSEEIPRTAKAQAVQTASQQVSKPERVDPITITVTTENPKEAIRLINDQMNGYGSGKRQLTETVRQAPGSLTAAELSAFLKSIEPAGSVRYDHNRFKSIPSNQTIPFVLKLRTAAKTNGQVSSPTGTVSAPAAAPAAEPPAAGTPPAGSPAAEPPAGQ